MDVVAPDPANRGVRVEGLTVRTAQGNAIVEDVSLDVEPGEVLGIVGESGSGKTTTALALLGFAKRGAMISAGTIEVGGIDIAGLSESRRRAVRGRVVSYVPQDPGSALSPSIRVGDVVGRMLGVHGAPRATPASIGESFGLVELPVDEAFQRRFPHQLSGGQQQRVVIAMALACKPPIVVLDEPTTGLDVVTQARVLKQLASLRDELGLAVVYVSHDLAVVGRLADRIAVMYAGRIVECGLSAPVLSAPNHPYTRGLIGAITDHRRPRVPKGIPGVVAGIPERPPGCAFSPRCSQSTAECDEAMPALRQARTSSVRCIHWEQTPLPDVGIDRRPIAARDAKPLLAVDHLRAEHRQGRGVLTVANDVSFTIGLGECVALVGESGSGKTTIARCLAGLHVPVSGRITLEGRELPRRARERSTSDRRRIQIVMQNPNDSLNPRESVEEAICRPARFLRGMSRAEARVAARELLEQVRMPARIAAAYPRELSGGERQRVSIARALASEPQILICDEITSALDVSIQATMLELLATLKQELGLAQLFITHDLGVVASVADHVIVLNRGALVEEGSASSVLGHPQDPYTRQLIDAAPSLEDVAARATAG